MSTDLQLKGDSLRRQLEFPYQEGTEFVTRLHAAGGFDAVDEAFVVRLPKYVWLCERPGPRGKTIGSSPLR
jgi:hypothetical protein